jgi:hypothetical protein
VQLSLALAHNHDGLILTWEEHGQGGLLCWFKVENRPSSAQYLGNSDTESRTWRRVMMAAFNKHRRSRNLCRCKCSGNADWGRSKRKHCILMERMAVCQHWVVFAPARLHQQHGGQFEQGARVRTSAATQRSRRLLFDAGNGGGRRSPSLLLSCPSE